MSSFFHESSFLQSISAIESALQKHSSGSASASFTGRGQSLGGSSEANPPPRLEAPLVNLDPQVKKLLYFFGAYILFWYLSR
jgi:thioredoxin 1